MAIRSGGPRQHPPGIYVTHTRGQPGRAYETQGERGTFAWLVPRTATSAASQASGVISLNAFQDRK